MSQFMQDAQEYIDEMDFIPDEQKHTLLSQFRTKEAEGITDVEEAMRSICVDMGMPEDDARATELRASQPQICVASIPTDRLEARRSRAARGRAVAHDELRYEGRGRHRGSTLLHRVRRRRRREADAAIYASYADAQPRNEAKQHDSRLVTFGGFFARREAQPPPETDREVCEFISARRVRRGRAYPERTSR